MQTLKPMVGLYMEYFFFFKVWGTVQHFLNSGSFDSYVNHRMPVTHQNSFVGTLYYYIKKTCNIQVYLP